MSQGILGFTYDAESEKANLTALGGLPLYLELAHVGGLTDAIRKHLSSRQSQGWSDVQVVLSLILLNLAGGDHISDLERVESDGGFAAILRRAELHGLCRAERRELERRWRKARKRAIPSQSAVLRYLDSFHDPEQEKLRQPHTAFIPKPNGYLQAFPRINSDFLAFVQSRTPSSVATLDLDATLIPSHKEAAWWWMMILALNLNNAMKRLVLGGDWVKKRLRAIRFRLIHLAGRLISSGRTLTIRLSCSLEKLGVLIRARERLRLLATVSA